MFGLDEQKHSARSLLKEVLKSEQASFLPPVAQKGYIPIPGFSSYHGQRPTSLCYRIKDEIER